MTRTGISCRSYEHGSLPVAGRGAADGCGHSGGWPRPGTAAVGYRKLATGGSGHGMGMVIYGRAVLASAVLPGPGLTS